MNTEYVFLSIVFFISIFIKGACRNSTSNIPEDSGTAWLNRASL